MAREEAQQLQSVPDQAPVGTESLLYRSPMPSGSAKRVVSRALPGSPIGIARVANSTRNSGLTDPYEREPAYLVVLQLVPFGEQDLWVGGRTYSPAPYAAGALAIYDLERNWVANIVGAYDCMQFFVPHAALADTARDIGVGGFDTLRCPPQAPVVDPVMHAISMALQPALAHPEHASKLFVDQIALTVCAHLAHTYSGPIAKTPARRVVAGLARWQENRAKDLIRGNLEGHISLQQLADACSLSRSHFAKAFRVSTGMSPHGYLVSQRLDLAQSLLLRGEMSLSEIAHHCGFADQSHFSRTFMKVYGTSPKAWQNQRS